MDESEGNSVKEQLEILSRGRLGYINQLVQLGSIYSKLEYKLFPVLGG